MSTESPILSLELAQRLKQLGRFRILDLHQAAFVRGILQEYIHSGIYYVVPPDGVMAAEVEKLFDEYKDKEAIHLAFHVQNAIDIAHKPIIPLDSFVEKYFADPPNGMLKVTAVARAKLAELNAIIDELKIPFDAHTFPGIDLFELSEYRAPAEGRQTSVGLHIPGGDWKRLTTLDESIKELVSESNMIREVWVSRHTVKGLEPEIVLTSMEATTPKGHQFLVDLATYIQTIHPSDRPVSATPPHVAEEAELESSPGETFKFNFAPRKENTEVNRALLYRTVLESLGGTLKTMKEFADFKQTVSGNLLLMEFPPKGFIGLGGHFTPAQEKTLETVYRVVKLMPDLGEGWLAHYNYDKESRMLSVKVGSPDEKAPPSWKLLR
jgi:hypothetical protein